MEEENTRIRWTRGMDKGRCGRQERWTMEANRRMGRTREVVRWIKVEA